MHERDPTKRIPKSLGTDAKLFGTFSLTDVAVALLPGVLVVLLVQVLLPSSLTVAGYRPQVLTLPIAAGAIGIGALFVYLTPAYASSLDWVETFIRFHRGQRRLSHEDAKRYTQLERVHPDRDALERTDGALLGFVQVSPPTMALATDEEWAAKTEAFQNFCNTVVEYPLQIYSTTQPFPVDEYLARYEARLNDPDVKSNPRLAALIKHYLDWYETDLDERRMTIRDHYVIVPVTPGEVQFERESLTHQIANIPLVGVFVKSWFAPRIEEQREALFDELDERLRRTEVGLREIDGCAAHRVEVADAARLVSEFWTGEKREYEDWERVLRTRPIIGGTE